MGTNASARSLNDGADREVVAGGGSSDPGDSESTGTRSTNTEGDVEAAGKVVNAALDATRKEPTAIYAPNVLSALRTIKVLDRVQYAHFRNELRKMRVLTEVESQTRELTKLEAIQRFEANRTDKDFVIEGGDLHLAVSHADKLLAADMRPQRVYQRAGFAVRVVRSQGRPAKNTKRPEGSPTIQRVETPAIRARLTELGKWSRRISPLDITRVDCTADVAAAYLATPADWTISELSGVIETPTLRPDGSILDQPGYDPSTELLFDPGSTDFGRLPQNPMRADAEAALALLIEPLSEFPFVGSEALSVALAAILTALNRRCQLNAPAFGFTAPKMANGKSLLADAISMILTGRRCAVMPHETDPQQESKRLLAILMEGDPIVCIDNVSEPVKSNAMCSILTQPTYKDRLLGASRTVAAPTNCTWLYTGNNLTFEGDLTTRLLISNIDSGSERPEERRFSRNLYEWIPDHRVTLVRAALTILRAWYVADCPRADVPPFGRFETWEPVRHALIWLGCADPCKTRYDVEAEDPERVVLVGLFEIWHGIYGDRAVTVREVIQGAEETDSELADVLHEICVNRDGTLDSQKLGTYLKQREGRPEGGYRLQRAGQDRRKVATWRVTFAGTAGTAGSRPAGLTDKENN